MTCGLDLACTFAQYLDPWFTWWAGVFAFIKAWWWIPFGALCMAIGAHLGPVRTYAVLTAGIVALVVRFWPAKGDEPDYETGENELSGIPGELPELLHKKQQLPKKPKTLLDLLRG